MDPWRMHRATLCAAAAATMLASAGCAPNFYLSESEVAAYQANLRTEASANDLLSHFANQRVQIEFAPGPTPRIRSTNILEVLRAIPELFFLEQGLHQIRLDRLSRQIEEQLDVWIAERLYFLLREGGERIKLEQLERVDVTFLAPPVLNYQPDQQAAKFDLRLRVQMTGTLEVRGFLSDGHHRLTLTIDNYRLRGVLEASPIPVGVPWLRLIVNPQPGSVSVQGNAPDRLKREMGERLAAELSSPVDESRLLSYDHFALPRVTLARTQGQTLLDVAYRPRPEVEDPVLDVVARGADGNLYHSRRVRGTWGAAAAVPMGGPIAGDPALVASGPDQLDVVAVAPTGELVYAGWRNGAWGNVFRTSIQGQALTFGPERPSVVATAPGQLEVVALGSDRRLYHLRRLNGQWVAPQPILEPRFQPPSPLRDPMALQVGNQMALFYVDGQNRLFYKGLNLEWGAWGESAAIDLSVRSGAAAAACSEGRIDVVYTKPDLGVSHRVLQLTTATPASPDGLATVSGAQAIGGTLLGNPALACSGYQRMELVGRGQDGRLVHNRFSPGPVGFIDGRRLQGGWQGWEDASDRFFGTVLSGRVGGMLSLVSTRAGQVHLAVAPEGAPSGDGRPRHIFHNSYDVTRFGYAPWKAVHWRGLQRIGLQHFVGQPALALSGRQLEFAVVGSNGNVWHAGLVEYGLAQFAGTTGSAVRFPLGPVALSSGPGIVDVLYLGADGVPKHLRYRNTWAPSNLALDLPPGRRFNSPLAAVGFGGGQVEVVAVAQDGSLHHWRHRNGRWEPPRQLPGIVISAPILVNTGAGQLELFAIGTDQRLYRWSFRNGQWENPSQISSPFGLNAVLFGQQAASSWGDGTVDLVVVEAGTNRMFHRRVVARAQPPVRPLPPLPPPGSPPAGFQEIGGTAGDVPVLTAFGPTRLNILVTGSDGRAYATWGEVPAEARRGPVIVRRFGSPAIQWRRLAPLSGSRMLLGGAARLGDQDLAAVAVDPEGRIFFSRLTGGRWSGFLPVQRQTSNVQRRPLVPPALALH